jgi:predicted phosphodiesterase
MLLIGDIHINSTYKDKILTAIRDFIANQPEEKNLIFLGDFVYHFSYDRGALLSLYDLFLDLYSQGKSLYILAGNHDRLGSSFVFEEAKKAFQLVKLLRKDNASIISTENEPQIHFITTPFLTEIEGKHLCFLPYMLDIHLADYPGIEQLQDAFYHEHIATGNKNQIFSAKLHLLIQYFKHHQPNLTFIHHYYFDGIAFPGQKSKFSFRDVAVSSQRLDDKDLQFISGHLHQAFYYKNYLCTGSIRATSPLEENDIKGFFSLREGKFSFYESGVKYYFSLDREKQDSSLFASDFSPLSSTEIQSHHTTLQNQIKMNFP